MAVDLDEEARHRLAARLDQVSIPGKRVLPGDWHLTLRFIGSVEEATSERVLALLDSSDLGTSFQVGWDRLGAFPRPSKATVLWLGVSEGATALERLAESVEEAVQGSGVAGEERPFRPHLTLSRIRPPQEVTGLVGGFEPVGVTMWCRQIHLLASHLDRPRGMRYERVASFPLG